MTICLSFFSFDESSFNFFKFSFSFAGPVLIASFIKPAGPMSIISGFGLVVLLIMVARSAGVISWSSVQGSVCFLIKAVTTITNSITVMMPIYFFIILFYFKNENKKF